MGAAKNNPTTVTAFGRGRFSTDQIRIWEADRCAAFAVAIERLRGWPVHASFIGDEVVRLQAEDARDRVYDPRGIFSPARFSDDIIMPLGNARADWPASAFHSGGFLRSHFRCVGEEGLAELGVSVDEAQVRDAIAEIEINTAYLGFIPERPHPRFPALALSRYSWRHCVVFAEALSRITGLPPMIMQASQVAEGYGLTGEQIHAVVQYPDGTVEDVWGRQSQEAVARRYAMTRWTLSEDAHHQTMDEAYRVRPEVADEVDQAEAVIRQYREGALASSAAGA